MMTSPEFVNFIDIEFESSVTSEYEIFLSCKIFSSSARYLSSLTESPEKGRVTGLIRNGLPKDWIKKIIKDKLNTLKTIDKGIISLANFLIRFLFLLRAFLSARMDDNLDNFFSGVIIYWFFAFQFIPTKPG